MGLLASPLPCAPTPCPPSPPPPPDPCALPPRPLSDHPSPPLPKVNAGETAQVHERTLAANFANNIQDIDGQADILIMAPTCIGPYTKDHYMNPLLVNTYSLG